MAKVKITNYGSVHIQAGWYSKELELAQGTVEDLLLSLDISGGRTLHDLLVEDGRIKAAFTLLYNGLNVQTQEGLKTRVKAGDNIVAIDVLYMAAGG